MKWVILSWIINPLRAYPKNGQTHPNNSSAKAFVGLVLKELNLDASHILNYLLKFNNTNTIARCEISSKLIIKTPQRRQSRRSGVFIVNLEHF